MDIAVIGHGNVGGTLAGRWAEAGHTIIIGARDPGDMNVQYYVEKYDGISSDIIYEAAKEAEVILIATPSTAVPDMAHNLGDVSDKIIIDATNSVSAKPEGYRTGAEALKKITGCPDVVKGFNTTGYENMADPLYDGVGIDMFTAGDSMRGKQAVADLAQDLGFENCYDFGGDDKFELIEQFALCWINLAVVQGHGRDIALKVIKR
ncbi:MAG: NAD(P)-binding domain-containing protein [Balneolaceae bacterium]|nr:NAD(P)-binding domain-containing protein [Balneolaceae bacterium]